MSRGLGDVYKSQHVVNYNVAVDDGSDPSWHGSMNGQGSDTANGLGHSDADVIFLHRIVPGKANRSYGVHVAKMAGLPTAVIHRAEEILVDLEQSGHL